MTKKTVVSLNGDDLTGRKCVMCKHPATKKFRPFCSKRCADLDLGKWLNASYIVSDTNPQDQNDFSSDQVAEIDQLDR
ncbi:MAG: DNA gyrase inhibitor YacG [Hyphomicrobiales bacterium]